RPLASADGSFGGLVLPDNVALGPECIVLLLDREHHVLKRFDPCDCAFVKVPCVPGQGGGMIAACGNLYICDPVNRRVLVFSVRGITLGAIWKTPLPVPWSPVAVAADTRGRIYVGDPDNGSVHIFTSNGRRLRALQGLGAIEHLTVDCAGRLYVQAQGTNVVSVVDPDSGEALEQKTGADEVADRFGKLPLTVTPAGHLQLDCGTFDGNGDPVATDEDTRPLYELEGMLTTQALDSILHRCLWDRLQICGEFPDVTSVRAFAYTSETELPDALIAALPPRVSRASTPPAGPPSPVCGAS